MEKEEIIKKAMSIMGKLSHKKKPRSKEFYRAMQKKSTAKKLKKKHLSTPTQ